MTPRSVPPRPGRSVFDDATEVERYDRWFDRYPAVFAAELEAIRQLLPPEGEAVEVGVGTGRFASVLGIRHGVDPSAAMRRLAIRRGVEAVDGVAERLPYGNASFDAVLMVTTDCFIDDLEAAFRETCRVLRPGGVAVVALIDRDSPLGRLYQQQKDSDPFFREARFRSVGEITAAMERAGLVDFAFRQTLFRFPDQVTGDEPVREGHGEGSFVVVRGRKPLASLPLPAPLAPVRLRRRLNRFAVEVEAAGAGAPGEGRLVLHLPNSGRMEELLQSGTEGRGLLAPLPGRRTAGDLLLVRYAGRWVSVDARMPNRLFAACMEAKSLPPFAGYHRWEREARWGAGRIDFLLRRDAPADGSGPAAARDPGTGLCLVETKSCNLVEDGVALFPDAPTVRGARHLAELGQAVAAGHRAAVVWFVQRDDASLLRPHHRADPAFARALADAVAAGVEAYAYRCLVTPDAIYVLEPIPVEP